MKRFLVVGFLAVFALFGNFWLSADAHRPTIAEKFAASGKVKTEGASGIYEFDKAHSSIGFRVKHLGLIEVPGFFRDFTGMINYDAKDVAKSSVEFTAKMESVDTGIDRRDEHLRSKDFFEVEKFPEMTFKSTKIEKKGGQWMVSGDLTMKGVTKKLTFPFDVAGFVESRGSLKMGAMAETVINRRDFNVNYGGNLPNGAAVLSDDIKVNLQIEAAMQAKENTSVEK